MTYLQDLTTIRDDLAAALAADATAQKTNPKPTYNVDGRGMDWNTYRTHMMKLIMDANQAIINANGAAEAVGHVLG